MANADVSIVTAILSSNASVVRSVQIQSPIWCVNSAQIRDVSSRCGRLSSILTVCRKESILTISFLWQYMSAAVTSLGDSWVTATREFDKTFAPLIDSSV